MYSLHFPAENCDIYSHSLRNQNLIYKSRLKLFLYVDDRFIFRDENCVQRCVARKCVGLSSDLQSSEKKNRNLKPMRSPKRPKKCTRTSYRPLLWWPAASWSLLLSSQEDSRSAIISVVRSMGADQRKLRHSKSHVVRVRSSRSFSNRNATTKHHRNPALRFFQLGR